MGKKYLAEKQKLPNRKKSDGKIKNDLDMKFQMDM